MNQKICENCQIPHNYYCYIKVNDEELDLTSVSSEKKCVLHISDKEFMEALFDNGYTYHTFIPFKILRKVEIKIDKNCPYHLEHLIYDWGNAKHG